MKTIWHLLPLAGFVIITHAHRRANVFQYRQAFTASGHRLCLKCMKEVPACSVAQEVRDLLMCLKARLSSEASGQCLTGLWVMADSSRVHSIAQHYIQELVAVLKSSNKWIRYLVYSLWGGWHKTRFALTQQCGH